MWPGAGSRDPVLGAHGTHAEEYSHHAQPQPGEWGRHAVRHCVWVQPNTGGWDCESVNGAEVQASPFPQSSSIHE